LLHRDWFRNRAREQDRNVDPIATTTSLTTTVVAVVVVGRGVIVEVTDAICPELAEGFS
jgi:hypothetical protein